MFIDDTAILATVNSFKEAAEKAQSDVNKTSKWIGK